MRLLRQPAFVLLIPLTLVVGAMLLHVVRLPALPDSGARPAAPIADIDGAVQRLAAAVRLPTISTGQAEAPPDPAFGQLHRLLSDSFPLAHRALRREVVGGASLLYTWEGSDTSLPPLLVLAHMDVVPVDPASQARWQHPPFAGTVAEGYLWGRGTMDMKHALMASMEGVERLLAAGVKPRRTVLLAFGHDEEQGGQHGAAAIARLLQQRGVRAWFSIDEGALILQDFFPGARRPIAQIGVSEKGSLTLELRTRAVGGHASMPPPSSAIGQLGAALGRLEAHPMAPSLDGPGGAGLLATAPALPLLPRLILANDWLTAPMIVRQLSASPPTNAMIRTTAAVTMISGGVKENVLPTQARAIVNFRLAPGDSIAQVKDHVIRTINDPAVQVTVAGPAPSEAAAVASRQGAGFALIERTIGHIAPGTLVVPGLVVGATDSRHYQAVTESSYRFVPVRLRRDDVARFHGTDERIDIGNYGEIIGFYERLIRQAVQ